MAEKPIPAGLLAIAVCSALFGLAMVYAGWTALTVFGLPGAVPAAYGPVLILALGVFLLMSSYGLWTVQPWGRGYSRWLYLGCIPLGAAAIFPLFPWQEMSNTNTAMQLAGIAVDIAVLIYLGRPAIVKLFDDAAAERRSAAEFVRREPHF